MAGLLFVLPGALFMLALSVLYALARGIALVDGALFGIKAAVLVIVVEAIIRIGRRALKILAPGRDRGGGVRGDLLPAGAVPADRRGGGPDRFPGRARCARSGSACPPVPETHAGRRPDRWREAGQATALWLAVWWAPVALAALTLGADHVLVQMGLFFSKLAVVSFGGAYALLAYMAQQVVETYGWLKPGEMVDGLGLAETTPGPLILVTQFVGFLAAFRAPRRSIP